MATDSKLEEGISKTSSQNRAVLKYLLRCMTAADGREQLTHWEKPEQSDQRWITEGWDGHGIITSVPVGACVYSYIAYSEVEIYRRTYGVYSENYTKPNYIHTAYDLIISDHTLNYEYGLPGVF